MKKLLFLILFLSIPFLGMGQEPRLVLPVGHTDQIYTAVFSPDGKLILTSSNDNTIKLWDVSSGKLLNSFEGHIKPVVSANFSPDGNFIVSASWDMTVRIWNVKSGEMAMLLNGHLNSVHYATYSPDGKYILSVDEKSI